jgi:hypothetical protein
LLFADCHRPDPALQYHVRNHKLQSLQSLIAPRIRQPQPMYCSAQYGESDSRASAVISRFPAPLRANADQVANQDECGTGDQIPLQLLAVETGADQRDQRQAKKIHRNDH